MIDLAVSMLRYPIVLSISVLIFTICMLKFTHKLLSSSPSPLPQFMAAGLVNSLICIGVVMTNAFGASPTIWVPLTVIVISSEYVVITRIRSLLLIYVAFLVMMFLAAASIGYHAFVAFKIIYGAHVPIGAQADEYAAAMFLVGTLILLCFMRMKAIPISAIGELLHARSRGPLLFLHVALCTVSILITLKALHEIVHAPFAHNVLSTELLFQYLLKDFIAIVSVWVAMVMRGQMQNRMRMNTMMFGQLSRGRQFLRLAHGDVMMSFSANLTKDFVDEGAKNFSRALGETTEYREMIDRFIDICVHPDDKERIAREFSMDFHLEKLMSNPSHSTRFRASSSDLLKLLVLPEETVHKIERSGKKWTWLAINSIVVRDELSHDLMLFVYVIDVDSDMRAYEDMKHQANYDTLTGLLNRSALETSTHDLVARQDAAGSFFLIDLDFFKSVNDILGHPEGDRLLRETAGIIRTEFRDSDIVGRLGGDEFMAYSPGLINPQDVVRKAERLIGRGRRIIHVPGGEDIKVSFSIGIATCPRDGLDYDTLYSRADSALYSSKEKGKDRYTIYSEMDQDGGAEKDEAGS